MKLTRLAQLPHIVLLGLLWTASSMSGCQTTVGGQTLPSPTYLRDDVQFFPAGQEFQHPNMIRAIEEYKAAQAGLSSDQEAAP